MLIFRKAQQAKASRRADVNYGVAPLWNTIIDYAHTWR